MLLPALDHELGSDDRHRDAARGDLEGTLRILRDLKRPRPRLSETTCSGDWSLRWACDSVPSRVMVEPSSVRSTCGICWEALVCVAIPSGGESGRARGAERNHESRRGDEAHELRGLASLRAPKGALQRTLAATVVPAKTASLQLAFVVVLSVVAHCALARFKKMWRREDAVVQSTPSNRRLCRLFDRLALDLLEQPSDTVVGGHLVEQPADRKDVCPLLRRCVGIGQLLGDVARFRVFARAIAFGAAGGSRERSRPRASL